MDVLIEGKTSLSNLVVMGFKRHVGDLDKLIVEIISMRFMGKKQS